MTDQVRLEGHGLIARASVPVQETSGDLWLPIAPTASRVARPGGGSSSRHHAADNADIDTGAAARRIAQQAMDEARLGLSDERSSPVSGIARGLASAGGTAAGGGPQTSDEVDQSSAWCGICSEDAVLRCTHCEADSGGDGEGDYERELFCSRCFKEVHQGDPEMKAHRPQALSGRGGPGEANSEGGGRNALRKRWRR